MAMRKYIIITISESFNTKDANSNNKNETSD